MSDRLDEVVAIVQARRDLPSHEQRRRIRQEAKVSLATIAELCGVSRETVRLWESGAHEPYDQHVVRYSDVLWRIEEGDVA